LAAVSRAWKLLQLLLTEVKSMKKHLRIGFLVSTLIPWSGTAAAQTGSEDFYRQWVDYRDGEISITFDQTPVQFALYAIRAKTGFQIVIPSTTETKMVNLRLHRQPLEPAVRSLISTIGFKNFALMYDGNGRPLSAVVVGSRPLAIDPSAAIKSEPAVEGLTAEQTNKLQKDLERWTELKQEERGRIEDRLKNLPASETRELLVTEYGRQVLGLAK
jgi:type II secretory pathway component GspD/PulD (secretin)